MSVSRLTHITRIGVEQMGDLADSLNDPDVLRLENLDTEICRPPQSALECTKRTVDDDVPTAIFPFSVSMSCDKLPPNLVGKQSAQQYDWKTSASISAGSLSGILNVLLATLEPGDEVLMTDPIYSGLSIVFALREACHALCRLIPSATAGDWIPAFSQRLSPGP